MPTYEYSRSEVEGIEDGTMVDLGGGMVVPLSEMFEDDDATCCCPALPTQPLARTGTDPACPIHGEPT